MNGMRSAKKEKRRVVVGSALHLGWMSTGCNTHQVTHKDQEAWQVGLVDMVIWTSSHLDPLIMKIDNRD